MSKHLKRWTMMAALLSIMGATAVEACGSCGGHRSERREVIRRTRSFAESDRLAYPGTYYDNKGRLRWESSGRRVPRRYIRSHFEPIFSGERDVEIRSETRIESEEY